MNSCLRNGIFALLAGAPIMACGGASTKDGPEKEASHRAVSALKFDNTVDSSLFENAPGIQRTKTEQNIAGSTIPAPRSAQTHVLTIKALDRRGKPLPDNTSTIGVVDLETGNWSLDVFHEEANRFEIPAGRYAALITIVTGSSFPGESSTFVYEPEITMDGDVTLEVDARRGRKLSVSLDDPSAKPRSVMAVATQSTPVGPVWLPTIHSANLDTAPLYAIPSGASPGFRLRFHSVWTRNGQSDSPFAYNILSTVQDRIPDDLTFFVRQRDLALVQTTYAAQGLDQESYLATCFEPRPLVGRVAIPSCNAFSFPMPATRTEYFTPASVDQWSAHLVQSNGNTSEGNEASKTILRFPSEGRYRHTWNTMPLGPALAIEDELATHPERAGDDLAITIPMYTDAHPDHVGSDQHPHLTGTTTLRRNGQLIAENRSWGTMVTKVPPEKADYELSTAAKRFAPWSRYAIEQSATWTFSSEHVEVGRRQRLPLMAIRYEPKLDEYGRAPAGRPYTFELRVERNPGAPSADIRDLTVSASYDEGITWQPASTVRLHDTWRVILVHPKGAHFVSLRAKARDRAGNSVEQTMIRSYGLTTDTEIPNQTE